MKRVVYLLEQPLDERNFERFGIQAWMDHGWSVEVWDLTPWAHPPVWREFLVNERPFSSFNGYCPLSSARDLRMRLRAPGQIAWFIDLTGESYHSLRAKWSLIRKGAVRATCNLGAIPTPLSGPRISLRAKLREISLKGPRGMLKWLSDAFFLKLVAPRVPLGVPVAIVGGEISAQLAHKSRQIVRAHNFDYDIYLKLLGSNARRGRRYVVFIDQDYCFHPEFIAQRSKPIVTPEHYFPALRTGLTAIGQSLDADVRIAAHPRAAYDRRNSEFFENFTVETGKTAQLIQECYAVICHDSTAMQFAVLFEKPMIFITTNELSRAYEGRSIMAAAAELGQVPVNLDQVDARTVDWSAALRLDRARYAAYKNRYIKTAGSPELPLWKIVIGQLEESSEGHRAR